MPLSTGWSRATYPSVSGGSFGILWGTQPLATAPLRPSHRCFLGTTFLTPNPLPLSCGLPSGYVLAVPQSGKLACGELLSWGGSTPSKPCWPARALGLCRRPPPQLPDSGNSFGRSYTTQRDHLFGLRTERSTSARCALVAFGLTLLCLGAGVLASSSTLIWLAWGLPSSG